MSISIQDIVLRLFLAALLGCLVGIERERKDWSAGMRTHMLVCMGAALAAITSAFGFQDIVGTPNVVLDPSRIAAQVISGIGFLCAGTILFLRQEIIRGLTTAAGLWTVGCVGLAIGAGLWVAGVAATIIIVIILAALKPLEKVFFGKKKNLRLLTIIIKRGEFPMDQLQIILQNVVGNYVSLTLIPWVSEGEDVLKLRLRNGISVSQAATMTDKIRGISGVVEVTMGRLN